MRHHHQNHQNHDHTERRHHHDPRGHGARPVPARSSAGRGRPGGRRGGARRGDIRGAILLLLADEPMHGYQLMQEIAARTDGAWRPSPGAIYPRSPCSRTRALSPSHARVAASSPLSPTRAAATSRRTTTRSATRSPSSAQPATTAGCGTPLKALAGAVPTGRPHGHRCAAGSGATRTRRGPPVGLPRPCGRRHLGRTGRRRTAWHRVERRSARSPSMKRSVGHEQYFTDPELAERCVAFAGSLLSFDEFALFVEPSAGEGAFLRLLPRERRIGIDLEPRDADIARADFLQWEAPTLNGPILTIGNPPFGQRAALAMEFMARACTFSAAVAFILPAASTSTRSRTGWTRASTCSAASTATGSPMRAASSSP